jgi:DNA-binding MarR family transcriptional regulator
MAKSVRRNVRGPRTDSDVAPIGDPVDLYALPLTALVTRLSYQIVRELADVYAHQRLSVQPLDASLFILLATDGGRLTALAKRLNTTKQALTFVVDRLERDGYLIRVADPIDKRAKRIQLTASGQEVAATTDAALRDIERHWRSRAGDAWPDVRAALADMTAEPD